MGYKIFGIAFDLFGLLLFANLIFISPETTRAKRIAYNSIVALSFFIFLLAY